MFMHLQMSALHFSSDMNTWQNIQGVKIFTIDVLTIQHHVYVLNKGRKPEDLLYGCYGVI